MWKPPIIRNAAPFLDEYDVAFGVVLVTILLLGAGEYIGQGTVLSLITAITAFIALYRLRHQPDKDRPTVREDFEKSETSPDLDFGFRNFGPGPAFNLQIVAAIEQENDDGEQAMSKRIWENEPHEQPVHLEEGDFWSFISDTEENWLSDAIREYTPAEEESGNPLMVKFYYTYTTHSGARVPTDLQTDRDDEEILDKIYDPSSPANRIELWRLAKKCGKLSQEKKQTQST
jgi:hypothetical protein